MNTETEEVKKKIKGLHTRIKDKTGFAIDLSAKFGVEPSTVRTHWFGPLLSVPKKHRERVIEELEKVIKQQ